MRTFGSASAQEYLGNPSDSNGNGQGKIFSLKPATDPDTLAVLDARRRALSEPNERLNRSAKAAFCEIIDRALDPRFYDSRGVVTISDTVLAQTFGVSARTVFTWKQRLVAAGYVWLSQKFKSNMWPITTYHLTCLHKPRPATKTDSDGTYGGGKFRAAPVNPGLGCRKPGQPELTPLPGSRQTPPEAENAVLQAISGESRQKLPVSPEENFGSEPKKTSGESRSQLRARAEENFGSEPKKTSGESRSLLPATPEADFRHLESLDRLNESETLNRLSNRPQEGLPKGKKPARKLDPEAQEFMARAREVLGMEEMTSNGGLWLTNFRANRADAWAVINETASAIKERRVDTTPPRFAMDYWKQLLSLHRDAKKPTPARRPVVLTMQPERREKPKVSPKALAALKEAAR